MQEKTTKGEFSPSMCRLAHTKGGGREKNIKTKNQSKDGGLWFCFALSSSKEKRKNNLVSGIFYFRQPLSLHFFFVRRKDSLLPIYFTNCCGLPQSYLLRTAPHWYPWSKDRRCQNDSILSSAKLSELMLLSRRTCLRLAITVSH